jgi:glutamate/tyrosine decarboxylase-like PLP-dependent enzyme
MRAEYRDFPQPYVYRAFEGLARADSATVDPHKLGYLACGAGAFVCRDNRAMPLLAEQADYVFAGNPAAGYIGQYARVGQFTPEGSRPGAMAAAAYVSQRVLPLDHAHFGVLARRTLLAAEFFTGQARGFAERVRDVAEVLVPCEPDSNLVCLALNPQGNACIETASRFVQQLHDRLRPDPAGNGCPAFLASSTALREQAVGRRDMQRILRQLGLDGGEAGSVGSLSILRHSLMNPFLLHAEAAGEANDPITQYFVHLEGLVRELAAGLR